MSPYWLALRLAFGYELNETALRLALLILVSAPPCDYNRPNRADGRNHIAWLCHINSSRCLALGYGLNKTAFHTSYFTKRPWIPLHSH